MEKMTIAKVRGMYAKKVESEVRGFNSYLKEIISDFKDYTDGKQATDERKKLAFDTFNNYAFNAEILTLAYLRKWLPCIDSKQRICDYKLVTLDTEKEMRETFTDFDFVTDEKGQTKMLKPVSLWTANKLLQKFAAAKKAETAAANQIAAAEREKQKAESELKRIEMMREKVAAYDAKKAAEKQQTTTTKAESKTTKKSSK